MLQVLRVDVDSEINWIFYWKQKNLEQCEILDNDDDDDNNGDYDGDGDDDDDDGGDDGGDDSVQHTRVWIQIMNTWLCLLDAGNPEVECIHFLFNTSGIIFHVCTLLMFLKRTFIGPRIVFHFQLPIYSDCSHKENSCKIL